MISIGAASNCRLSDTIVLRASSRGYKCLTRGAKLIGGKYIFAVPKRLLPEGIITFTLTGKNLKPLAERLYFNSRKDQRLKLEASFG